MLRIAHCSLAAVLCGLGGIATAAPISLIGSELSLATYAQATQTSQLFVTSFPASAIVSETDVEFPDVESLFDPTVGVPPGFASSLVDVAIDAGSDFITIDFDNSAPYFQFATAFQNTYVFTFENDIALQIVDAVIDEGVTTLGLTDSRVAFEGNQLFVNIQSLPFNTSTFARIELTAAEASSIPVPASLPLVASGLAALAFLRRRRAIKP